MLCMTVLKPLKPQFMHEFMGYLHAEIKTKFTKRAKGLHQRQAVLGGPPPVAVARDCDTNTANSL